jgi:hypothetical protein
MLLRDARGSSQVDDVIGRSNVPVAAADCDVVSLARNADPSRSREQAGGSTLGPW